SNNIQIGILFKGWYLKTLKIYVAIKIQIFSFQLIFTQILPALIADTFLAIFNKKPKYLRK
ncbi:hypothetical protein EGO58_12950, partial [Limosilactobacillus reuteri]